MTRAQAPLPHGRGSVPDAFAHRTHSANERTSYIEYAPHANALDTEPQPLGSGAWICVGLLIVSLTSCVPWVVRPIEDKASEKFDAVRYVDSIWTSKVVNEPSLKRGEARITRVEDGRILLDNNVALLIGPVIRGTALRDALPFIQFSQFTNQLEYARVANALNEKALKIAQDLHAQAGDMIRYAGAASPEGMVPVKLERL